MFTFLLTLQIIISISIITLVMLQHGKGADMGAAFGSGSSGTVFGARGSGSFFSRATAILGALFFINCLLIASPLVRTAGDDTGSLAEQIEQQEAAAAEQAAETAEQAETKGQEVPTDVPALTDEPAAGSDVPDVPTAAGDVPETPAAPVGKEDLPE
ncbi:MAG: preprotein translocase subunit SecG [Gammaproteobacteria bacterium]|nr:MAG: preprotein translocase subunit SecG [Gammaproteobacteria bacterium]